MSSLPGFRLEDFIMWQHDLVVGDERGANASLAIAEALGVPTRRVKITSEQFVPIIALYEPHRLNVESLLEGFDEESQSWRDYGGPAFDWIPDEVFTRAEGLVRPTAAPSS